MKTETESKAEHVFSLVETFWPSVENARPSAAEAESVFQAAADLLYSAMEEAGLSLNHALCFLVCATEKNKHLLIPALPRITRKPDELAHYLSVKVLTPIGIVFGVIETEKRILRLQVRGFGNDERTQRLLSAVQTQIACDFKEGKILAKQN